MLVTSVTHLVDFHPSPSHTTCNLIWVMGSREICTADQIDGSDGSDAAMHSRRPTRQSIR